MAPTSSSEPKRTLSWVEASLQHHVWTRGGWCEPVTELPAIYREVQLRERISAGRGRVGLGALPSSGGRRQELPAPPAKAALPLEGSRVLSAPGERPRSARCQPRGAGRARQRLAQAARGSGRPSLGVWGRGVCGIRRRDSEWPRRVCQQRRHSPAGSGGVAIGLYRAATFRHAGQVPAAVTAAPRPCPGGAAVPSSTRPAPAQAEGVSSPAAELAVKSSKERSFSVDKVTVPTPRCVPCCGQRAPRSAAHPAGAAQPAELPLSPLLPDTGTFSHRPQPRSLPLPGTSCPSPPHVTLLFRGYLEAPPQQQPCSSSKATVEENQQVTNP